MAIHLLENTLKINIYYDEADCSFDDNICVSILEDCPEEEKIFRAQETNLYLTPAQATQLVQALTAATSESTRPAST
ncbi:MAG: hypothetical protein CSB13_10530 [Chloroflexi bacterium]|nr:MAG: hypothetical protein CSB13_10530 [Chloroflexota bacterium]